VLETKSTCIKDSTRSGSEDWSAIEMRQSINTVLNCNPLNDFRPTSDSNVQPVPYLAVSMLQTSYEIEDIEESTTVRTIAPSSSDKEEAGTSILFAHDLERRSSQPS
jgi:hypothetical protein